MNKQEFLSKLTNEELKLLSTITSDDIKNEIKSRSVKDIKIGNCFCKYDDDAIFLLKVINIEDNWFACEEIGIEDGIVDIYTWDYCYDDLKSYIYINPAFYTKVANIIKEKEEAINEIITKFDNNISRLLIDLKDYVDC